MLILQGCHERLMTWFMRYTSAISGLLFGSISLQVGCSTMHTIWYRGPGVLLSV